MQNKSRQLLVLEYLLKYKLGLETGLYLDSDSWVFP